MTDQRKFFTVDDINKLLELVQEVKFKQAAPIVQHIEQVINRENEAAKAKQKENAEKIPKNPVSNGEIEKIR